MGSFSQEDVTRYVNSIFKVNEFTKTEYTLEYKISDREFKSKFEDLARKLEDENYLCKIEEIDGELIVMIQKFTQKKRWWLNSTWTPRILFVIVIGFVMIDGYSRTVDLNNIMNLGEPLEMAIIYTLSLIGILGVHEMGHMIAVKKHRLKTTWPFFIPGIPTITIFPTFGAFIQSKGLTINRQILFDIAIAGPIAGLAITLIVALYGAYSAPLLELEVMEKLYDDGIVSDFPFGEPLFLKGALAMFGKGDISSQVIITPILWASWIGFFITFLNLMPAWQLDGGHMARTIFGPKWHKYTTYCSFIILAIIGFEWAALIFYFLSRRNFSAIPLDDISPLPRNRKFAYIGIILLAILCIPIPENICIPILRTMCIF